MNDQNLICNDGVELNLGLVFRLVKKHLGLLILAAVLGAGLAVGAVSCFMSTQYQSSVLFYVNNSGVDAEASSSVSSGDLSTSRNLVDSYIVILKTREALLEVLRVADVDIPYLELEAMISASAVNKTEFFRVTVTGPDPYQAEKIANAIGEVLPGRISAIIEGTRARVVEPAVAAWKPIPLGIERYGLLGCLGGILMVLGFLLLRELSEGPVWNLSDIRQACSSPVLSCIPRGAGREAYRPVCAKLALAFADDRPCRVLGIVSIGEEASPAAAELARALAQEGKRVLLVEGNLGHPSLRTRFSLETDGGLSEFLAGQRGSDTLICRDRGCETLMVIPAGAIPPDPMALLCSVRMQHFLEDQRKTYDYLLLDLGTAVPELALDGVLLAACRRRSTRRELKAVVQTLEEKSLRILGILAVGMREGKP